MPRPVKGGKVQADCGLQGDCDHGWDEYEPSLRELLAINAKEQDVLQPKEAAPPS